ncbi:MULTISPECIES: D-2-hydroxyacid dehydrogenase [Sphaerospermopsis]|jgi:phosphoglycerate dehydrogenase-like enzyme|uniref:D-isomer specific 2-hydroxyacid dehydrogenase, NAD-binding protein n=1 Tax=Sphaerospermopsis reniformis TaxID=531300 RepID=A0A479ZUF6_9CYAN|nr:MULTISPECIES: D-2-hydroxyacid dehydrogenase [Sphaerospermopsis]MBD2133396.1 D-2-hydroxyacid dehydrogenase [Sphaerospermopsis sp. FACHB-1094]MBD2146035.1 D-2-hydroxyacid dehydrogenase [Sphaerospermopsis sp. FACHB-1194]GCL35802.1 D-isomer specific 2-hydroxyacid dehydrogenase, NAD-binding protein [Sphaerospermopsis reniformis]
MKLILPVEIAHEIEPHLPKNTIVLRVDSEGNIDGDATDAEVYFSWFYLKPTTLHRVLYAAPSLRWHHAPNAGVNHILTPKYLERDLILTNGAGVHGIPIAEFVITYLLAYSKRLPSLYKLQNEHDWQRGLPIQELFEKTLLIIGAGGIGQEIAVRAKAFGMRIFGSSRHPKPLPNFDKVVGANDWKELLPEAEFVVIATPLTPETKGMIDVETLRLFRPDSYLINIARGAIVDESALIQALQEGWIAGAALDTVFIEPLPAESPLWTLPNVFITPHCSGNSPRVKERTLALFLDNFTRYRQGKPLRNVVDKTAGY